MTNDDINDVLDLLDIYKRQLLRMRPASDPNGAAAIEKAGSK